MMIKAYGEFIDKLHVFPIRVYYEDTDAGGIVYYANYLRFAERARSEMLRLLGIESGKLMQEEGLIVAVKKCSIDFLQSARLDDLLFVKTRLIKISGASIRINQTITKDELDLVYMDLKLASISLEGRPLRLPLRIRNQLEELKT